MGISRSICIFVFFCMYVCIYIYIHIIFYLLQEKLVILNLTLTLQHLLFHSLPKSRLASSQCGRQGLWPRAPPQGRSCAESRRRHSELLLPTDNFRASGAECIWRLSRVLPATRAFFFGSWHDNYFIGRLFTNITTCERDGKTGCSAGSSSLSGFANIFQSFLPPRGKPVSTASFATLTWTAMRVDSHPEPWGQLRNRRPWVRGWLVFPASRSSEQAF